MPIVPFKLNQDCGHHIPRQQRKVTNWPAYDASLRQRGSLTVWFTDEAVDAWAAALAAGVVRRGWGRGGVARPPHDPGRAALVFGARHPDGPDRARSVPS